MHVLNFLKSRLIVLSLNDKIFEGNNKKSIDFLPSDALIAETCKHYGIRKIATFDEDFEKADFLEVLEI